MPTYEHICTNEVCKNEWEEVYSIVADPPTLCPKCNQSTAKRAISLGGKGVVVLTGNDLVEKIKSDTNQMRRDLNTSEKHLSNFIGESKYESTQKRIDKR